MAGPGAGIGIGQQASSLATGRLIADRGGLFEGRSSGAFKGWAAVGIARLDGTLLAAAWCCANVDGEEAAGFGPG